MIRISDDGFSNLLACLDMTCHFLERSLKKKVPTLVHWSFTFVSLSTLPSLS